MEPNQILVVDDSKLMHKMFEVLLRRHSLVHALDGREALEKLEEHPRIDLILLDINMPVMDGLEFLEAVRRADHQHRSTPVVVISTEGREEDTIRAMEMGADRYIKKPFGSVELQEAISEI